MSRPRSILEDPATEEAPVAAQSPRATGPTCPRCDAPLREDQEWCLNCGTAVRTRVAGASGWRAPVGIVAALLAIALIGLVAAFLAVSNDPDDVAQAPAPTAAQQTAPPAPTPAPPAPTPEPDPITPETIPEASGGDQPPAAEEEEPTSATVSDWPAGESAWTVVLLSSRERSRAERRAKDISDSGTEAGVLESGDFKSLRSGYFVVFSGQYDSRAAAERALSSLEAQAPQAYVRRVTPR